MSDSVPALSIRGVRFAYPQRGRRGGAMALDGVTIAIEARTMVAILGPNGGGKSTLLKVACGALPPDSGDVDVFGAPLSRSNRARLSVVFQSPGLDPHLTVVENLRCQGALYGMHGSNAERRIDQALRRANLFDRRSDRVRTLSGGLARRVDLCRAMLHDPSLLLLDEPTVGLDPSAREAFLAEVEGTRRDQRVTVLLTTHLVDEADRCDRVILMHRGRVVADGTPGDLRRSVGDLVVRLVDGDPPPPSIADLGWRERRGEWVLPLIDESVPRDDIARTLVQSKRAFAVAPPSLADLFEGHTGDVLVEPASETP